MQYNDSMNNSSKAVKVRAASVRVGDRPVNISGAVERIERVPGGFIFRCGFGVSFVRCHGEEVSVRR